MNKPLFNVIIPVYNAERFINKSVESVLKQTYDNINIILVDDGSTDRSGIICDKYESDYENVVALHTLNQGSSSARNQGINLVKNGYIAFLDADDYFDSNLFSNVSIIIDSYNPDCIDFGFKYVNRSGEVISNLNSIPKNSIIEESYIKDVILPPLLNLKDDPEHFIYDFAWNKIYKASIIKENSISFIPNRKTWEDRPFVIEYVNKCKTYYSMDNCYYNYMDIPNSLSRRYTNEFFDVILENYNLYREKFGKEYNFETQYVYGYWCDSFINMLKRSLEQTMVNQKDVTSKVLEIFTKSEVINLFIKRNSDTKEKQKVLEFIKNEDIESLIKYYKKIVKKESEKKNIRQLLSIVKHKIVK